MGCFVIRRILTTQAPSLLQDRTRLSRLRRLRLSITRRPLRCIQVLRRSISSSSAPHMVVSILVLRRYRKEVFAWIGCVGWVVRVFRWECLFAYLLLDFSFVEHVKRLDRTYILCPVTALRSNTFGTVIL